MKRKRFTEEQIIGILKTAEAAGNIRGVCREHNITEQTLLPVETEVRRPRSVGGEEAAGVPHDPHTQGKDFARSAKSMPWSHTVFSNLKPWIRGTFHGVSRKHLQRYLDEFVYRFDRRWKEEEREPFPYHRLVAEQAG